MFRCSNVITVQLSCFIRLHYFSFSFNCLLSSLMLFCYLLNILFYHYFISPSAWSTFESDHFYLPLGSNSSIFDAVSNYMKSPKLFVFLGHNMSNSKQSDLFGKSMSLFMEHLCWSFHVLIQIYDVREFSFNPVQLSFNSDLI